MVETMFNTNSDSNYILNSKQEFLTIFLLAHLTSFYKETIMTKRAASNEKTSSKVATQASKILRDPKSTKAEKSVAGSALTQTKNKK